MGFGKKPASFLPDAKGEDQFLDAAEEGLVDVRVLVNAQDGLYDPVALGRTRSGSLSHVQKRGDDASVVRNLVLGQAEENWTFGVEPWRDLTAGMWLS
jgi:hypothetical protein